MRRPVSFSPSDRYVACVGFPAAPQRVSPCHADHLPGEPSGTHRAAESGYPSPGRITSFPVKDLEKRSGEVPAQGWANYLPMTNGGAQGALAIGESLASRRRAWASCANAFSTPTARPSWTPRSPAPAPPRPPRSRTEVAPYGGMADDSSRTFQAGQTGLIVKIPEAEPAVRGWRERLDPSGLTGVPAHVTVLFPFLEESRVDPALRSALAELLGRHRAFDLRFEKSGRLPDVLHLVPEPATPLRLLTEAIAGRWPEAPPYGGRFAEIVPHLTIAQGQEEPVLEEIEADLVGRLPFTSRVTSVELMVYDGEQWQDLASFALGE